MSKKSDKTDNVVSTQETKATESIIVAQANDEVKVIEKGENDISTDNNEVKATEVATTESVQPAPSNTSQPGNTSQVTKRKVSKKVEASLLDTYDAKIVDFLIGFKPFEKVQLAYINAPKLRDDMLLVNLAKQEELTEQYNALMAKGRIKPGSLEFKSLQSIMIALDDAETEQKRIEGLDVSELARDSFKAFMAEIEEDLQAIKLEVFGKETTNSGQPEGSPKNSNGTLVWPNNMPTIPYWRFDHDLLLVQASNMPVNYREANEIQANWILGYNRKDGNLLVKIVDNVTSFNGLFKKVNVVLGKEEGEHGSNSTAMGSRDTDKKQLAKHPVLTLSELWQLVGASPDEVSSEGIENEVSLGVTNQPIVNEVVPNNGATVPTIETEKATA